MIQYSVVMQYGIANIEAELLAEARLAEVAISGDGSPMARQAALARKLHGERKKLKAKLSRQKKGKGKTAGEPKMVFGKLVKTNEALDRLRANLNEAAQFRKGQRVDTPKGPGKVDRMITVRKGSARRQGVSVILDSGKKGSSLPSGGFVLPVGKVKLKESNLDRLRANLER